MRRQQAELERIDHRSNAARGIEAPATIHLGRRTPANAEAWDERAAFNAWIQTSIELAKVQAEVKRVQSQIIDITSTSKRPAVIVGDLNATPEAPELQSLFSTFTDTFAFLGQNEDYTFGADLEGLPGSGSVENPNLRIDYILTGRGATATSAKVIQTTASDHLPIVAELSIQKSPNGKVK